jgi:hypothetical protein
MRRVALALFVLLAIAGTATSEEPRSVTLGAGGGVAIPGRTHGGVSETSFVWGFHVNIAVLETFRVSPSSEIYRISAVYATDLALAFHYVIPFDFFEAYIGVAPGLTAWGTSTSPHVGGLLGFSVPILDDIGGFAQFRYKVLFSNDTNVHVSHLLLGLLFSF